MKPTPVTHSSVGGRCHAARMTPHPHDVILARLAATGADQHPWSVLILAALESPDTLDGPAPALRWWSGATATTFPATPH